MGAEQSTIDNTVGARYGFHVLRVDELSPAAKAGLIAYFDYIVAVNGVEIVSFSCHFDEKFVYHSLFSFKSHLM